MLGRAVSPTPIINQAQALAQSALYQARLCKEMQNFEIALIFYGQVKVAFKLIANAQGVLPLTEAKNAVRQARTPETAGEDALRQYIAEVYFERAQLLEKLNLVGKAQASYQKAQAWGYQGSVPESVGPVTSKPARRVLARATTSTEISVQQLQVASSAQDKSVLIDYLFEKALSTLSSLEVSNKPSLFLVYAHDNPAHGRAEAGVSKYLIDKLSQIRVNLYSDQAPKGEPYASSLEELKEDAKLEDIVTNQLCLLPAPLRADVKPVDKVVVCCSEVLGNYLKWADYEKFYQELCIAYLQDLEAYSNGGAQLKNSAAAIRQVVWKFSHDPEYKDGFHHVLTEIAFLQIRREELQDQHGIIPVALTPNSYQACLEHFIPATAVRMEDIPRFEGHAHAGRVVYENQSRHWVLFKLIERLLVGSDEARTFLNKFWSGYSDCIARLNGESALGELELAKLLDGIFDGIRTALHSQLAFTVQQQHRQWQMLNVNPRMLLKETYFASLKEDKAWRETEKLYVPPRGKVGESKPFALLDQMEAFLGDPQLEVILLTGESGAGKTTFNRILEKHVWEKRKEVDAIPLCIALPSIDKPEHDLIAKALKKKGLSEVQIQQLKKDKQKFIFILDGYDEIRQTQNLYLSNGINQVGGWQGQMVISCRSEYLGQDYRSRFQPNPQLNDEDGSFQEIVIMLFSTAERAAYIDKYVTHQPTGWSPQQYQEALKDPHLEALTLNPFLLRVVLAALPHLDTDQTMVSAVQLRLNLYEQFIKQWFERNQQRLGLQDLTGSQRDAFRILSDEGFAEHGLAFVQALAVHLYSENSGHSVVAYSSRQDKGNWKEDFFGREEEKQLLRETWPLIRSGNQYRFIHKSVLEYGMVRALFELFDTCLAQSKSRRRGSDASVYSFEEKRVQPVSVQPSLSLSPRDWVDDLGVVRLLTELVKQEEAFKQQLLTIIERSKTDAQVRQTAAHAITILVKAGVSFNGEDLRGIRIPGADLSFGMFDSAQLQGADLRKVTLRTSWLRQANLSGAQMAGVQFGEWAYLEEESYAYSCAYSPDGKTCAIGLRGKVIHVYDTSNWTRIHTLAGHTKPVNSVVYSPNGAQIASSSDDKTVRLWDAASGKAGPILQGHTFSVNSVVYSPNGAQIASGSDDETVRLWDARSGTAGPILQGHTSSVQSVVYSPNGAQIASGSKDNTVRLWDAYSGQAGPILPGHTSSVYSVAYSPSGTQIASGSRDNTVRLWDVHSGKAGHILQGHTNSVTSVVYSPSGAQIASGSADNAVRLWDAYSGQAGPILPGHTSSVNSVTYSPSGAQIASGSADFTVRLWDAHSRKAVPTTLPGHTNTVISVVYSPSGAQIASGSFDQTVQLWDAHSGKAGPILKGHTRAVSSVVYSPNGAQIASGSVDKTVRLWHAHNGKAGPVLEGHTDSVTSVVYSPNGAQIASGSSDETVRLWDAHSGKAGLILKGHTHYVISVAYSPSGAQIASGSADGKVRLWDARDGKPRHVLQGHAFGVRSVVYSPSGAQVASASADSTVRLWDAHNGQAGHILQGHTRPVNSAAYSPSGAQIASGSADSTVRLWDVASGKCLSVIKGFSGAVESVGWMELNGQQYLVTGSEDKSVRQWVIQKEPEGYQVKLLWSSGHEELTVADTLFEGVQGLSKMNARLLKQRGVKQWGE